MMLFSNMDFNSAYFPNYEFAHIEIEESFRLILGKIIKWSISLANLFLLVLCIKDVLAKFR